MHPCPECGYPNDPGEHRCEKCGIRFDAVAAAAVSQAGAAAPAWRGEVRRRVESFRERRAQLQIALPLPAPPPSSKERPRREGKVILFPGPTAETEPAPSVSNPEPPCAAELAYLEQSFENGTPVWQMRPAPSAAPPPQQAHLDFPRPASNPHPTAPPPLLALPVASLGSRFRAARRDGGFIALGFGLAAAASYAAGAELVFNRAALAAGVIGLTLLPLFYAALFLLYTAGTPGMVAARLRLVDFDGRPASRARRLARVLATVPSAGTFLLGFLWAVVDEERLTWHDRISETCLTAKTAPRPRA